METAVLSYQEGPRELGERRPDSERPARFGSARPPTETPLRPSPAGSVAAARPTPSPPSPQECVREKLSLIHGFLQADVQNELSELEAKLRCKELSEVRAPGFRRDGVLAARLDRSRAV